MSDEWGPWVEHDGKGCPCVGQYVHALHDDCDNTGVVIYEYEGIAGGEGNGGGYSWNWDYSHKYTRVIRYRIRKPRGLTILQGILREVEREPEVV